MQRKHVNGENSKENPNGKNTKGENAKEKI